MSRRMVTASGDTVQHPHRHRGRRDSSGCRVAGASPASPARSTKKRVRQKKLPARRSLVTETPRLWSEFLERISPPTSTRGRKSRTSHTSTGRRPDGAKILAPAVKQWEFAELLASCLKNRGISCGSLVALRVLSEGIESGMALVQMAYLSALDDAREAWRVRHKKSSPVGAGRGGLVRASTHR